MTIPTRTIMIGVQFGTANINADRLQGHPASDFATAAHSHIITGITPDTTSAKFQISDDNGATWADVLIKRTEW